jgi:hypothetical protein
MKVLAWLAFPLVATLLAMCWAAWRGRSRGPRRSGGAFASVEDFRRFNEALAAPGPSATRERRRGFGRRTSMTVSSGARSLKGEPAPKPDLSDARGPRSDGAGLDRPTSTGNADRAADGPGTVRGAGTLDSAQVLARKLGPAEMFGSTKIAGQGS